MVAFITYRAPFVALIVVVRWVGNLGDRLYETRIVETWQSPDAHEMVMEPGVFPRARCTCSTVQFLLCGRLSVRKSLADLASAGVLRRKRKTMTVTVTMDIFGGEE